MRMLILHDLVEVECGDTPLFDAVGALDQEARERKAALRQTPPQPGFVPVEITGLGASPATSLAHIEVLLPGGLRLLVPCHEQQAIRTVIAALTDASATASTKSAAENRGC